MNANSVLTGLMNKARDITGLDNKLGLADLTDLMNSYELKSNPNLLKDSGKTLSGADLNLKNITKEDGDVIYKTNALWDQPVFHVTLDPGTYTYSAFVGDPIIDSYNCFVQNKEGTYSYVNKDIPYTGDGNWHLVKFTFNITDKYEYRVFITNVKKQKLMKLEKGNIATPDSLRFYPLTSPNNNLKDLYTGVYEGSGLNFSDKPPKIMNNDKVRVINLMQNGLKVQLFLDNDTAWARSETNGDWTAWQQVLGGGLLSKFLTNTSLAPVLEVA